MKLFITLAAAALGLVAIAASHIAPVSANFAFGDGKTQPKHVVLNQKPKTDKEPDKLAVPFNHESHSLMKYNADMTKAPECTECHHTDQPKAALKGGLLTSEREEVLTAAVLAKADAKPVKTCIACHAQKGTTPTGWPKEIVFERANGDEVTLTNEKAYHINCIECHRSVKKVKAATTAPIECADCHNGKATSGPAGAALAPKPQTPATATASPAAAAKATPAPAAPAPAATTAKPTPTPAALAKASPTPAAAKPAPKPAAAKPSPTPAAKRRP